MRRTDANTALRPRPCTFLRTQEAAAVEMYRHQRLEAVLSGGNKRYSGKLHHAQRKSRLSQAQQEERNELHETDEVPIRPRARP